MVMVRVVGILTMVVQAPQGVDDHPYHPKEKSLSATAHVGLALYGRAHTGCA